MSLRIFETPAEAAESSQPLNVSLAARILFCVWASLVAVIPTTATTYSALQITRLFRGMTDAESAGAATVLGGLQSFNIPLVIALAVAALLAFGIALVLAMNPGHRPASVGLPFSIAVVFIGATPAALLWFAETTVIDVIAGRITNTPVDVVAQNVSNLLFSALALSLVAHGATFLCAIISLFIPAKSRTDPFSAQRAFVWAVTGALLLAFAGVYLVLV